MSKLDIVLYSTLDKNKLKVITAYTTKLNIRINCNLMVL